MSPLFAGWDQSGHIILSVISLLGALVVGFYVLVYAGRCLLTVVEQTANDVPRVVWPDELVADWAGNSIHLGALLAVWLAPAGILSNSLSDVWLVDAPSLRFVILAIPGLWLILPVGLLSSLSANSRWVIIRPSIIAALGRILPSTIVFYLLTALLAVLTAVPWCITAFIRSPLLLFVTAPLAAAGLLTYARLLGRLGLIVRRRHPAPKPDAPRKKVRPVVEQPAPIAEEVEWVEEVHEEPEVVVRPVQIVPPLPAPLVPVLIEETHNEAPCCAADEEYPLIPLELDTPKRWTEEKPEDKTPYQLRDEAPMRVPPYQRIEDEDIAEMGPRLPTAERTRRPERLERRRRPSLPIESFRPLFHGVFGFPWYPGTLGAWLTLSTGLLVFGLFSAGVMGFLPLGD